MRHERTEPLWINGPRLRRLLPMREAVEALRASFNQGGETVVPLRTRSVGSLGELLVMPAMAADAAGVKVLAVNSGAGREEVPARRLIGGVYILFDERLVPTALLDAAEMTALRTAAVSALATDLLALPEADRLVVFGVGVQATAHVTAMRVVRPIREVVVVGRGRGVGAFVRTIRETGIECRAGTAADVAVGTIVCTCTTSATPIFDGALLSEGVHINAVGAHGSEARELDDATISQARLVVEDREAALREAGELAIPIARGVITSADILADMPELVRGRRVRRSPCDVTVLKSVGIGSEDLAVARAVLARLHELGDQQ